MRAIAIFVAVNAALIATLGWVLGLLFASPGERHAIWVSAWVALVVQGIAFVLLRRAPRRDLFVAWGTGALLRFSVFALYGLVVVKAFSLDLAAALLSLAAFFFVSTLVEPLLLKS